MSNTPSTMSPASERAIAPTPYEARRQEHLKAMRARIPEHIARLTWPADWLRAEREARLRVLVQIAQERSSWHRERLGHLNPKELTEYDLTRIPVMTKHDLMTNYDQIVTNPRLTLELIETHLAGLTSDAYLLDRFHAVASSGSSGYRGVFVYDWESWIDSWLSVMRYAFKARFQNPELAQRPTCRANVAARHATHMSSAQSQTFSDPEMTIAIRVPITLPLPQIVAGLNEANPDAMLAYPSILPALAHEARAGRLRIAPRSITTGGEPLLPEIRSVAEETWGVPVMNWWASSEASGMGISCGHGAGLHLTDDLLIVEPVDAGGNPVPPGVRSDKIYLTNLYNPLLPLIRYEITDQITLIPPDETCACGSAHRRVDDVQGRLDDLFVYPGVGAVHPHLFRSRLGRERTIVEYQVRQTARGAAIAIRTCGAIDIGRLRRDIAADLRHLGLQGPDVAIDRVEHMHRQGTGKLKRFVPLD